MTTTPPPPESDARLIRELFGLALVVAGTFGIFAVACLINAALGIALLSAVSCPALLWRSRKPGPRWAVVLCRAGAAVSALVLVVLAFAWSPYVGWSLVSCMSITAGAYLSSEVK